MAGLYMWLSEDRPVWPIIVWLILSVASYWWEFG